MDRGPDSTPDFKRGQSRIWIVAGVCVVVGVLTVLALSLGVFERKRAKFKDDGKEGCPCGCDHSEAMAADLRKGSSGAALSAIDESLATIAEREAAGYVTERMIQHRLRLLDLERELEPDEPLFAWARPAIAWRDLRSVEGSGVDAKLQLIVHGDTTEIVNDRPKPLRACFVLRMQIENKRDFARVVAKPEIVSNFSFPISRWYVIGTDGAEWDGSLKAREAKSSHVIGYVEGGLKPGARVEADIRFESLAVHVETRARARWNQDELASLR